MGQIPLRANIIDITTGIPCTVTTDGVHGFTNYKFVRLTDLNGYREIVPVEPHGEDQLNNKKFRIIVTDTDKFYLQDPITFKKIDSSTYPPYITGGNATQIEQDFFYHED